MKRIAMMLLLLSSLGAGAQERPQATLYKSPSCSCCESHADHLRSHGYPVAVREVDNLSLLRKQLGVPRAFEGCHSIVVGGYVVEGHVPATVIDRLLSERPAIAGISLPGMPQGSPGMSGQKRAPFEIFEISQGAPKVYATE
jgi:hypothetical protein